MGLLSAALVGHLAGHGPRPEAREQLTIDVVRYGDIVEEREFCERCGLSLDQARSLRAHPYAREDDAAVVLLLRGRRRVGRYGLIPGRLRIAGSEHPLSWGSDWQVDEEVRGTAAAGLLLLRAMREVPMLAACGVSESARPIYRAARFDLLVLPRRVLLLRSAPFWRRRLGAAPLSRVLALPVDSALAVANRLARARLASLVRGFALERVARFDERLDAIDAAAGRTFSFPRDHREVNWALDHPWASQGGVYRYLALYLGPIDGERKSVGYALVRIRETDGVLVGSLLRWALRSDAGAGPSTLLGLLVELLVAEGVDIVELSTSDRGMQEAADRFGMLRRGMLEIACKFGPEPEAALRRAQASLATFEANTGEGDVLFL